MKLQPVVLSGGSGTRLWPLSREQYPKQLLALNSSQTMLQETVSRFEHVSPPNGVTLLAPIIVSNEEYRFIVTEQLRQIGKHPAAIVLEPVGRNTAPALTLAALVAQAGGEDPILLVMPADHVIRDESAFQEAAFLGVGFAQKGSLVTFGITPTAPETGYGYIRAGDQIKESRALRAYELAQFVEKPNLETAQRYLESGQYLWNSGIFMMKASRWLEEIKRLRSDIAEACLQAFVASKRDRDFLRVDQSVFSSCPADSIDFAVMEKVAGVGYAAVGIGPVVIPLDAGWSDVGAWDALWQVCEKDGDGNVIKGDVLAFDTQDTLIVAENRLVACLGLRDVVVVETPDAVMVAHKKRTQDIKQVVSRLQRDGRSESAAHRKICRPWGYYDSVDNGERFQVKRIVVNPGASLSLQMHHHRAEHWIVVRGTARVTRGDEVFLLGENQSTYIPLGVKHRLENPGKLPLEIIEVQSGAYLGEDDIVRFEDSYGRG